MRKRISKQKEPSPLEQRIFNRKIRHENRPSPLQTVRLLLRKTECLQNALKFEKERIERIVAGTSIENVRFQEVQKNCSFEEFMKGYVTFDDIKATFTGLIKRNSLTEGITFMDFKLKNFIIMNNYAQQLRRINYIDKSDTKLTASRSTTKLTRCFKEMEIEVKRITKRNSNGNSRKQHQNNGSGSYVNLLSKNIERIRKNNRESNPKIGAEVEFKPILTGRALMQAEEMQVQLERLHTTPQEGFDSYGLDRFKEMNMRKLQQISLLSMINRYQLRSKLNSEKSQDTLRYQTEYDTEKIQSKRSKSKKNVMGVKKSVGRGKSTSRGKAGLLSALQRHRK